MAVALLKHATRFGFAAIPFFHASKTAPEGADLASWKY